MRPETRQRYLVFVIDPEEIADPGAMPTRWRLAGDFQAESPAEAVRLALATDPDGNYVVRVVEWQDVCNFDSVRVRRTVEVRVS